MDKEIALIDSNFFENVSEVLAKARKNAKTAVNLSMVYAYYEIGKMNNMEITGLLMGNIC